MTLTDEQRALYARHLLLPEIGQAGQARLCAATLSLPPGADPAAAGAAREYLERAGVTLGEAGPAVDLPSPAEVDRLAGDPALREAAAALAGAFAAVEAIKRVTGAGRPAPFPADLRLA